MLKKWSRFTMALMLILSLALFASGCAKAAPTTAKSDFTPDQAAELIYRDLVHHGLNVKKVEITNFNYKDSKTIEVDVSFQTSEGRNISQKATLSKESGTWQIKDHKH